ncbi:hypothetical protein QUC32_23160 [Novosphingobium resinovorum]|uniref:hypothetical protein n=1 Tax=Novosphingobium TaxID=165696 RepID=UPI001B3C6BA9|nr:MULTISPECIES: hypothetical protein [Novosphingobium]MBF7012551.1 hypothetical protein [Novosphingobium sp. HR1a]WJM27284.1 hypothetical protein QUC32_23160 [Novosphingobium resinovorum]
MAKAPTDAQVREYITGYYESREDLERFKIKSIGSSREGPECRDVSVYTEWGGSDPFVETCTWTVWVETDGTVYGEH